MPPMNDFHCNLCGFYMPEGWGGYQYVIDKSGKRIVCAHPAERDTILRVLAEEIMEKFYKDRIAEKPKPKGFFEKLYYKYFKKPEKPDNYVHPGAPLFIKERTGFNSYAVCLDCLIQFQLDLGKNENPISTWRKNYDAMIPRDERKCPKCGSENVKTEFELIGNTCPCCGLGTFLEYETGMRC